MSNGSGTRFTGVSQGVLPGDLPPESYFQPSGVFDIPEATYEDPPVAGGETEEETRARIREEMRAREDWCKENCRDCANCR